MPDILQDFPIKASIDRVFDGFSTPAGLDAWWTKSSAGSPALGAQYDLDFGPGFRWRARVTRFVPGAEFELEMTEADADWTGTRVGVQLETRGDMTWVRFAHVGWPHGNEHYRISCNCWALYLRVLRRSIEFGESVPYELRLDV